MDEKKRLYRRKLPYRRANLRENPKTITYKYSIAEIRQGFNAFPMDSEVFRKNGF